MAGGEQDNRFLVGTSECADLNQYWFSRSTIAAFVAEIEDCGGSAALVSSPSVYFSLPGVVRERCSVLDYDRQWEGDPGYVFYDFHKPEAIPEQLHGAFDFVLVDPPFITREVWEKYATTARLLAKEGGRILCTTIAESMDMMQELLGLHPVLFRPSIPSLVYQYSIYSNYESDRLASLNPEIDDEDWRLPAADIVNREVLQESSSTNTQRSRTHMAEGCDDEAADAVHSEATMLGPPAPGVPLLVELRERLNALKRAAEAVHAPLQAAVRRREASGPVAAAAAARAEAALDAAATAAAGLQQWTSCHEEDLAIALGEPGSALASPPTQDRWRAQAVSAMVDRARGGGMTSVGACKEFALANKQHAAAIFRLSGIVLDRIKLLRREAAAKAVAQCPD